MSTHNLCFEQKYDNISFFLYENFQFLEVKFSIYLNRRVFIMTFKIISTVSLLFFFFVFFFNNKNLKGFVSLFFIYIKI